MDAWSRGKGDYLSFSSSGGEASSPQELDASHWLLTRYFFGCESQIKLLDRLGDGARPGASVVYSVLTRSLGMLTM